MKILSTKWLVQFSILAEGDPFIFDGELFIKADPIKRRDMGSNIDFPCAVNLKNGKHRIFMEDVMVERANIHVEDD